MGEPHNQFPQPTRPVLSYDAIPYTMLSDNKPPQEFQKPGTLELPKTSHYPSSAPRSNFTEEEFNNIFSDNLRKFNETSGSREDKIGFSPPTGKTPKNEKEAVDELLLILIEVMDELNTRSREVLLRKFFSEIEREERLEKFILERLRQSKVKSVLELCEKVDENMKSQTTDIEENEDQLNADRSIQESVEELSHKLERFKVRTFEGVTEEEVKPKSDK